MNQKQVVWIGGLVGSSVGAFIPVLWGSGELSFSSVFFSAVGAIVGIYVGFKISRN
jgi:uncharacterized membrane protein YeaQ/YmgE (transglycosylase-associated protein family)